MTKIIIRTDQAPAPIGPYNQAVGYGDLLYISGQVCIDPATGQLNNANLIDETHQVMRNLQAILQAAGDDAELTVSPVPADPKEINPFGTLKN